MIHDPTCPAGPGIPFRERVELICFALIIAQGVFLVAMYWQALWIVQPDGSIRASDFTYFWTAGRQVLAGNDAIICGPEGQSDGRSASISPAIFLSADVPVRRHRVGAPSLCFGVSWLGVCDLRALCGGDSRHRRPPHRRNARLRISRRAVDLHVGPDDFSTAALLGASLGLMERRPILAGCLGLLTYKPQLGILFPLVLVVSGHWRMLFAAAATSALIAAMSWGVFGLGSWEAFFRCLPEYSHMHLTNSGDHWAKMQSLFVVVRLLGGSEGLATAVHGIFVVLIALTLVVIWRSAASFAMKAAALAVGALLATPYLFLYDMAALAVPLAFLVQEGRRTGFLPHEMSGIGVACLLVGDFSCRDGAGRTGCRAGDGAVDRTTYLGAAHRRDHPLRGGRHGSLSKGIALTKSLPSSPGSSTQRRHHKHDGLRHDQRRCA